MTPWLRYGKRFLITILAATALLTGGCEGTDSRETVDDTIEEMTGKKDVERYQQMKEDLGKIQDQQADRYRQLDQDENKE